jgi:hypothetical protein
MSLARLLVCICVITGCLAGEEGMWTFDNLPVEALGKKYGFTPSPQWLEHLRLACVRFSDGGSGSFISPEGLVLTNHHVARSQLQKSSSAEHDYLRDGFYAQTRGEEMKSPDLYIDVLISLESPTIRSRQKQGVRQLLKSKTRARQRRASKRRS